MNQPHSPDQNSQAEIDRLREELELRDQVVQQLSQELYKVMVNHPALFLPESSGAEISDTQALQTLRQQMQTMEKHIGFYQEQINRRDAELLQLRDTVQELGDRNRMLEKVVQELPEVYRQKFAERLNQFKARLETLQRENHHLRSQLQNVATLAVRPAAGQIELADFPPLQANPAASA